MFKVIKNNTVWHAIRLFVVAGFLEDKWIFDRWIFDILDKISEMRETRLKINSIRDRE